MRKPTGVRARGARLIDFLRECLAASVQRPMRTVLTGLGTVLGVSVFLLTLGLASTLDGRFIQTFSSLASTEVSVVQVSDQTSTASPIAFPSDSEDRLSRLPGVLASGVWVQYQPLIGASRLPTTFAGSREARVLGVSGGIWEAAGVERVEGRFFDEATANSRVAVVDESLAEVLGLPPVAMRPAVFIDGVSFEVIGISGSSDRQFNQAGAVLIPLAVAGDMFSAPSSAPEMLIQTDRGAAPSVADQAPLALSATAPSTFRATGASTPTGLSGQVSADVQVIFLALAATSLVIGTLVIATTTLLSVTERTAEIGVRRALGATRRQIGTQFAFESAVLGTFAGVIGTLVGVSGVVVVAEFSGWQAIIERWTVLVSPIAGFAAGLAAGALPAMKAARIEPVAAIRRA